MDCSPRDPAATFGSITDRHGDWAYPKSGPWDMCPETPFSGSLGGTPVSTRLPPAILTPTASPRKLPGICFYCVYKAKIFSLYRPTPVALGILQNAFEVPAVWSLQSEASVGGARL